MIGSGTLRGVLIVPAPDQAPGQCALTHTSEGPFVDTLIDYDDFPPFGRVYIAESTVMAMAQMFGATPPEASARREAHVKALEARLDQALIDLEGLKRANEALIAAGYNDRPVNFTLEDSVPGGGVRAVMEWVREVDDLEVRSDRAQAAIAVENREAAPRASLIEKCQQYVRQEATA